jgi:hypothetical protein
VGHSKVLHLVILCHHLLVLYQPQNTRRSKTLQLIFAAAAGEEENQFYDVETKIKQSLAILKEG